MITIKIECSSCKGTGLYKGVAERGGAAVVCHSCNGTGESTFSYNEFTGRKTKGGINRVYQGSFGYCIGDTDIVTDDEKEIRFSKFGCTYGEWLNGKTPEHIKDLYCPYMADNKGMGNEPLERCKQGCHGFGSISNCDYYNDKATCWDLLEKSK